jgi:hypothetical protein
VKHVLEHHHGDWEVKPLSDKGKDGCCGYVFGNCALEDCHARIWYIADGDDFNEQPDVVMLVGEDAVREFEKTPEDRAREVAEKKAATAALADANAKAQIIAAARAAVSSQVTSLSRMHTFLQAVALVRAEDVCLNLLTVFFSGRVSFDAEGAEYSPAFVRPAAIGPRAYIHSRRNFKQNCFHLD